VVIEQSAVASRSSGVGSYRLGVIGDPVAHSLSPALHQPALDALGIAATYERWHTTLADLPARLRGCRAPDVLGANVTVPHKVAVIDYLDDLSPAARRAGAVNTIVNREGTLFGDNTDISGFAAMVSGNTKRQDLNRALVLGAGGAARAVVLALEVIGVSKIVVANRSESRARELVESLAPAPVIMIPPGGSEFERELTNVDILVNATSLGWKPTESPFDLALLERVPRDALIVDLTYRQTELLTAATHLGLETIDGLPMLVHQGAAAFELFTGQKPPIETMFAAAESARI
jgi:shikimate dehydrogenase